MSYVSNVIFTVIDAIIIILIFCSLTDRINYLKNNKFRLILFTLFYSVVSYWATLFIPSGINTFVVYVMAALCASFFIKTNIYESFFIWLIAIIFAFITEFSILIAAVFVSGYNVDELLKHQMIYYFCTVVSKIIEFAAVVIINKYNLSRYLKLKIFNKYNKLPILIVIQAFLLGLVILCVNNVVSQPEKINVYNIFFLLIYLFFVVMAIIDFIERERLSLLRNQYSLLQEHTKNIETIVNITRREKHDFYNHLNTIYGLSTLNKPDMAKKIQKYINEITGKSYLSNKSFDTGNDYIDALLAVKNNYAIDNNIGFKVDIKDYLDRANIDDKDLVAVFSNIIDNSIEALLSEVKNKNAYISISAYIYKNSFFVLFKNNGPEIPEKNIKRIFKDGFSTKLEKRQNHGFGLYIVKQKVEKWNGTINVSSNEKETEFLIRLELKNKNGKENGYYDSTNDLQT